MRPAASASNGSSYSSGARTGRNLVMSSLYSSATDEVTQPSPKLTRAGRSRTWCPGRLVSTDCSNRAILVSAHSRLPNSSGEFVALASVGPLSAWATL